MKKILEQWPDINYICIDVANGYQEAFSSFVAKVRKEYPDKVIIAGNVITPEMTEQLIIRGADIVKCGIGPGSVCTTRTMTGVGYPQISGIMECSDAAHGLKGTVVADGGCRTPGDVSKAYAAGADFVMLGGMLAGHQECELPLTNGSYEFYGMSSDRAMENHKVDKKHYRGSEGKVVYLPDRGPVEHTIEEILGGVRSTCTYIGADKLKYLPKCATFIQTRQVINTVFNQYE
jgi:GMP reductase